MCSNTIEPKFAGIPRADKILRSFIFSLWLYSKEFSIKIQKYAQGVSVSILFLFGENTEQTINIIRPFITARYFSSERLRKDHGAASKRTGAVPKFAALHYFVIVYKKKREQYI